MEDRCATATLGEATLVAVFDGHDGSAVADHAAAHVVGAVRAALARGLAGDALWRMVFAGLEPGVSRAGSTATVLLVGPAAVSVAWVGDSRAILVTAAGGRALTSDHRIERADELDRCVNAGAVVMPPYVVDPETSNGLMVTRALGDHALRGIGIIADPEVTAVPLGPDDIGFVAATDGLWDVVGNDEAAAVCRRLEPQAAADRLVETVRRRGGTDNTTVIVGAFA
jgi:serine/threonine protein phosphatase PrpC